MSLSADFSSVYFGDNAICVLPESGVCLQTLDAFKKGVLMLPARILRCIFINIVADWYSPLRTDLSQLAHGNWIIHAGCSCFLQLPPLAKIG